MFIKELWATLIENQIQFLFLSHSNIPSLLHLLFLLLLLSVWSHFLADFFYFITLFYQIDSFVAFAYFCFKLWPRSFRFELSNALLTHLHTVAHGFTYSHNFQMHLCDDNIFRSAHAHPMHFWVILLKNKRHSSRFSFSFFPQRFGRCMHSLFLWFWFRFRDFSFSFGHRTMDTVGNAQKLTFNSNLVDCRCFRVTKIAMLLGVELIVILKWLQFFSELPLFVSLPLSLKKLLPGKFMQTQFDVIHASLWQSFIILICFHFSLNWFQLWGSHSGSLNSCQTYHNHRHHHHYSHTKQQHE